MGFYPAAPSGLDLPATIAPNTFIQPQLSLSTNAGLGNGSLRLIPFWTPQGFHISAMGSEFTAAGDAGSVLLLAGYADNGSGFPSSLFANPGSISTGTGNAGTVATGGTPGLYMCPNFASPLFVPPGITWWGGVIQGVTVTQPTIRCALWTAFATATGVLPAVGATEEGYNVPGITGALPNPFGSFPQGGIGACPRITFAVSSVP